MTTPSLSSLIASLPQSQILAKLITYMKALDVDVSTWGSGDPTRSVMSAIASRWAEWEAPGTGFPSMIAGGLLGLAAAPWLDQLGTQNYNTTRNAATFAECTQQIVNSTGVNFGTIGAEDVTFQNPSAPGNPTFRNTQSFVLGPFQTVTVTVEAELAGSGSNSIVGAINTIVSPQMTGVTTSNTTAAIGQDEESDAAYTARCQLKFASVSPAGPSDAYKYAITTPSLQSDGSNQTNVTRVRVIDNSAYGDAIIFVAGAAGAVGGSDVTKAQNTIEAVVNPAIINGQVISATNAVQPVTYELWLYEDIGLTSAQIQTNISNALTAAIAALDIGGPIIPPATSGFLYVDWLKARIIEAVDTLSNGQIASPSYAFKCSITTPAADVPLSIVYVSSNPQSSTAQVATLGTVTCTAIHLVPRS